MGDSEILSIENAVGDPIPAFAQRPEDGAKVFSSVTAEYPWDIYPNDPGGSTLVNNLAESEGQVATVIAQSSSEPGNGEGLTGRSSDKNVDCSSSLDEVVICYISHVFHLGPVVVEYCGGEFLDLGKPLGFPAEWFPREAGGFDAAANRSVAHYATAPSAGISFATSRIRSTNASALAWPMIAPSRASMTVARAVSLTR